MSLTVSLTVSNAVHGQCGCSHGQWTWAMLQCMENLDSAVAHSAGSLPLNVTGGGLEYIRPQPYT